MLVGCYLQFSVGYTIGGKDYHLTTIGDGPLCIFGIMSIDIPLPEPVFVFYLGDNAVGELT